MKIDLKKLKSKGVTAYDFEFLYEIDKSLLTIPTARFDGAARVSGSLELYNDSVDARLFIRFMLAGECTRCLKAAEQEINIELDETFFAKESDGGYLYQNDMLDLTECANEAILLNMPYVLLCDGDCKGLCSGCGADLNTEECKCKINEV